LKPLQKSIEMKPAKFYEELYRYQLKCTLCPHHCIIGDGKTGNCHVRKNLEGELYLQTYGLVSSMGFDPIEKKPLYHFYPGSIIFSVGSFGCNLKCKFCQNFEISQEIPRNIDISKKYSPGEMVDFAKEKRTNVGIAYTYNEPTVWFEFMHDIARKAKREGLKNVMVTNGYINPEPLDELLEVMDAFNVDLKAFTEDFYLTQTMSKLAPVKETLKQIRRRGKHLEITNLVVTGKNDNRAEFVEMLKWIKGELGDDTVLHLSRYFPTYKMSEPPTPPDTINELWDLAKAALNHVYIGNMTANGAGNTICPSCNNTLIKRNRYDTRIVGLDEIGRCEKCKAQVIDHI